MNFDEHYEGEPVECKCGDGMGAWHLWDEGHPSDAHWWRSSCQPCCDIASTRLKATFDRVVAEVGPEEVLRRLMTLIDDGLDRG